MSSYLFPHHVCLGFWKVRIEFLPFTYHVIFFFKVRIEFLPFSLLLGLFLKSKNRVVTFFPYHVIFVSKVRIEFLSVSLPCLFVNSFLFVCLSFWKVRIEFLAFFLPCDFFKEKSKNWKDLSSYFFLYLVIFFSKVRITFLPFALPCLFVCWGVCLFVFVFVCLFVWVLKSKNWVLTFYLSCDFFFQKDRAFTFFLTVFVCLIGSLFIWFRLFVWDFEK